MDKKTKIIIAILLLLTAGGVAYFVFIRKAGASKLGPVDDAGYAQILSVMQQNIPADAMTWLLSDFSGRMNGNGNAPAEMINGKPSKALTLASVFASEY